MLIVKPYVFITPSKSGSTSLLHWLKEEPNFKVRTVKQKFENKQHHATFIPDEYKDHIKILLVRNPYERFLSFYYYSKISQTITITEYAKIFKGWMEQIKPFLRDSKYEIEYKIERIKTPDEDTPFHMLCFQVMMGRPYSSYIEIVQPDHIVHMENVRNELDQIGFKTENPFRHDNQSKVENKKHFTEMFDEEMMSLLGDFLEQEAIATGYPVYQYDKIQKKLVMKEVSLCQELYG